MSEEELSKKRAIEFWDTGKINEIEIGTYKGLADIHKYLFQDVFPFAGEMRKVNIAKDNFSFAQLIFLPTNLKIIDNLPHKTFEEIIEKYASMNVAHPFHEGNGRSMRIWLNLMLKNSLGVCVGWEKIGKVDYLQAMRRSTYKTLELEALLQEALTDKINDREVYMKGIQVSYDYEGQNGIDIHDL